MDDILVAHLLTYLTYVRSIFGQWLHDIASYLRPGSFADPRPSPEVLAVRQFISSLLTLQELRRTRKGGLDVDVSYVATEIIHKRTKATHVHILRYYSKTERAGPPEGTSKILYTSIVKFSHNLVAKENPTIILHHDLSPYDSRKTINTVPTG